jgi:glycosyltransferase involved in cell wall biosynthesis
VNILFVNNQYELGGAETVMRQLRDGVVRAGHRASVRVAYGKKYPPGVTPLYPRLLSRLDHSRFHPVVARLFPRPRWTDARFRGLSSSKADLIHIHNFHGDYATPDSLAYLAARKPVVWTFHRFWGITGGCDHPRECRRYLAECGSCPLLGQWPIGDVDRTREELASKLEFLGPANLRIVAPSRFLAEMVRESKVGRCWKVDTIPNGVDPSQFGFRRKRDPAFRRDLGLDSDAVTILVVNRNFQDPLKGHEVVEQALKKLAPRGAQLVLAGLNSEWAAARLPESLRTVAVGYVSSRDRLAALNEAADVFLYASPAENFPCVILEAMSAQCCVVATPTSGVTEQIRNGETGFLADAIAGDSLAEALGAALANPSRLVEVGRAARARVEAEFSEQVMVDRHLELYATMIGERS